MSTPLPLALRPSPLRPGASRAAVLAWSAVLCLLLLATAYTARGHERPLGPAFIDATWRFEGDRFGCALTQRNPRFGATTFFHEAGEPLELRVASPRGRWLLVPTRLRAENPAWRSDRRPFAVPTAELNLAPEQLSLRGPSAEALLTALVEGFDTVIEQQPPTHPLWQPRMAVSGVRIRDAYPDYLACRDALLPVNWRQAERTRLAFPPGARTLPPEALTRIRHLAQYTLADPRVTAVYVDGYTDNRGTRPENLDLSRERALAVSRALVAEGVDAAMITTRYHGERYPVASNDTPAGRARNRRVTIRLERPTPEVDIVFAPGFGTENATDGEAPAAPAGSDDDPDGLQEPTVAPTAALDEAEAQRAAARAAELALSEAEEREILDAFARNDDN